MELTSETQKQLDLAAETKNLKKIEASLFLAARFLSLQEIVMLTDLNPLLIRELIDKLQDKYSQENSAMLIVKRDDSWKMDVKQEYTNLINKLATGSAEFTKAEQETLAVIAYKQPVKQSIIIKIRGNKAYDHVKHFVDLGLLKSKKQGHTQELELSPDFYDYFHLVKKQLEKKEQ
jgi:segregation and condensation protein B